MEILFFCSEINLNLISNEFNIHFICIFQFILNVVVQESYRADDLITRPDSKQSATISFAPRPSIPEIKSGAVPAVE